MKFAKDASSHLKVAHLSFTYLDQLCVLLVPSLSTTVAAQSLTALGSTQGLTAC